MYLFKMRNVNTGPIEDMTITFPFQDKRPVPLVIVGENGTGKSEVLSFIVDSLYEIAGERYPDVRVTNENRGYQYYKAILPSEIKIGKNNMYSYIEYKDDNDVPSIGYVFKCGALSSDDFRQKSGFALSQTINWDINENFKGKVNSTGSIENIFNKNVFCYFGPNRYEIPSWMGKKYFEMLQTEHVSIRPKMSDRLDLPISIANVSSDTLKWLLDVIVDSRCDVDLNERNQLEISHTNVNNLLLLKNARKHIEQIMSAILGESVYFGLNDRGDYAARFKILSEKDDVVIAPCLDSLSTGQLALFNMFSTIVRYADWNDVNNSIHLSKIQGIVLVDEAELHLHADLQRNVFPRLIRLFPNVQFVLTTHSPLILLGLDEYVGEENYKIIEMPSGMEISSEAYSQFQSAYEFFSKTRRHQKEMSEYIKQKEEKTLVVTEGPTDWIHLKAALSRLQKEGEFVNLDFEFLEYYTKNGVNGNRGPVLEMGSSTLRDICKNAAKIPRNRALIFVFDADEEKTVKEMSDQGLEFKTWGNNVYSLVLPVPPHRKDNPRICVEHLYTDEEIKTPLCVNGIEHRLYMGCEFDKHGFVADGTVFCEDRNAVGPDKNNIIDGSEGKRVFSTTNRDVNLAITKMRFAEAVQNEEEGFADFGVDGFRAVFEVISKILSHGSIEKDSNIMKDS